MDNVAQPMDPQKVAELRSQSKVGEKLPFECRVCKTKLASDELFRIGGSRVTKESRVVKGVPPPGGVAGPKHIIYCNACANQQLRLIEQKKGHRPVSNQRSGPSVSIPPKLLGKEASLAQLRQKKAAEAAANAGPPVWEMVDSGSFRAPGGLKIQKVDAKSWRVLLGATNVIVKGLQQAFEVAAELKKSL